MGKKVGLVISQLWDYFFRLTGLIMGYQFTKVSGWRLEPPKPTKLAIIKVI